MQVKKDKVRNKITNAARAEFLKHGFEKASLRKIAASSDTTNANIYNYFKNKDDLFCSIVQPGLDFIESSMQIKEELYNEKHPFWQNTIRESKEIFEFYYEYACGIEKNSDELRLLLYGSSGSSFENYREYIFAGYSKNIRVFLEKFNRMHPARIIRPCDMLIHSLAAMYLSMIEEILMHKPDTDEFRSYVEQIAVFIRTGFITVLIKKAKKQEGEQNYAG